MAEFPSLPLWTDAYLGDTGHLTTIEHGAYLLLLITMWRSKECRLADNDVLLARYARLTAGQWRRIRVILEPFFKVKDGWWTQGRLTDEWEAVRQLSHRQSNRAKGRWLKDKDTAMPRHTSGNASPSPSPDDDVKDIQRGPETDLKSRGDQLADLIGWDLAKWTGNFSRIATWLNMGFDWNLDILPTVREVMAKKSGSPPSTLNYFDRAIADAHERRLRPMPKGDGSGPTGKRSHHGKMMDAAARAVANLERKA